MLGVLYQIPWWVYAIGWYLCGMLAMSAWLSAELKSFAPYEWDLVILFWIGAGGGLVTVLWRYLKGDFSTGLVLPGPWARRKAAQTALLHEPHQDE